MQRIPTLLRFWSNDIKRTRFGNRFLMQSPYAAVELNRFAVAFPVEFLSLLDR